MSEAINTATERPHKIDARSHVELYEAGYVAVGGGHFPRDLHFSPDTNVETLLVTAAERNYPDDEHGRWTKRVALRTLNQYRQVIKKYGKDRIVVSVGTLGGALNTILFQLLPTKEDPSREVMRAQWLSGDYGVGL